MRSTTWSTVTNAFIISTVALLSLIPAADAYSPPALGTVKIISPAAGDVYQAGESAMVKWYVTKQCNQVRYLTAGIAGSSTAPLMAGSAT